MTEFVDPYKRMQELEDQLEQAKAQLAEAEAHGRQQERLREQADAQLAGLVKALRLALDALTDAEQYHRRACMKDGAHDHALLRKLWDTIPACAAAFAAAQLSPEPTMPHGWKHTERCLTGASRDKCICWPPALPSPEVKP